MGDMGSRTPCCDEVGLKKGPWTPEEDAILVDFIQKHGHGSWSALPKLAGLNRCGKSYRLRWTNYLRPDIKRGKFTEEEEQLIINLHAVLGNKWSTIAGHLPGRTDNEIKNFWNTYLRKKLLRMGIDPVTHRPRLDHLNLLSNLQHFLAATNINIVSNFTNNLDTNAALRLQSDATELAKLQLLQNMIQVLGSNPISNLELLNNQFGPSSSIPDILLHEVLGLNLNHQSNKLLELYKSLTSTGFPASHHQNQPNFLSFEVPDHLQPHLQPQKVVEEQLDATNSSSTPLNSLPNLASESPECSNVNEILENKVNPNECSNPSSSSTSTTFEMLGDFMCEEVNNAYWKDLI